MKVFTEISLNEFPAWSGAIDTKDRIIGQGLESDFESLIEELYPDGIDETQLNDILWFEDEFLMDSIGLKYEDEDEEDLLQMLDEDE